MSEIFTLIWLFFLAVFFACLYLAGYVLLEYPQWLVVCLLSIIAFGCISFVIAFSYSTKAHYWLQSFALLAAIPISFLLAFGLMGHPPLLRAQLYENSRYAPAIDPNVVIEKVTTPFVEQAEPQEPKHGYQSGPVLASKEQSYFISGRTREDLCKAIFKWQEEEDRDNMLAYINYKLLYSYYTIHTTQGYTIGDFTVTADSTITVPQWISSDGASEGTKNDWRAFKNAVASHEREHKDILINYANKLVSAFNNMGYYSNESDLKLSVDKAYKDIYSQMDRAQNKFDEHYGESESFAHLCR